MLLSFFITNHSLDSALSIQYKSTFCHPSRSLSFLLIVSRVSYRKWQKHAHGWKICTKWMSASLPQAVMNSWHINSPLDILQLPPPPPHRAILLKHPDPCVVSLHLYLLCLLNCCQTYRPTCTETASLTTILQTRWSELTIATLGKRNIPPVSNSQNREPALGL